jgi:ribosomal protein L7/L12
MEMADRADGDGPDERLPGWQYLEIDYDTQDRTQVRIDGVATTDGRPVGAVIAELGAAGWEMVSSAAGVAGVQVLWFRRPAATAAPDPHAGDASRHTVVLLRIGDARYDPERHALLVATIAELTGESGWRATRIVDKAPRVVAADVSADEAERIRLALERLGATVELR